MSTQVPARPRVPRAAFGAIVRNEARLVWRQPAGMIAAIGISLMLLVVFDEVHVFKQSDSRLGGLSAFQLYLPILIAFSIGLLALTYLPGPLVAYREQGILRRLSVTPVPASWVLAAQLAVQACLMLITVGTLLVVSVACFGQRAPGNPGGLLLAVVLSIASMFAIGPGLYYPMQLMPGPMLNISHFTPLGTSVQAIVYPMFGEFPPAEGLLVLAAYALVFGFLAMRFFRWE
ncbi:MAG TPA: ABC transporter permease [Streptosporangiaceae bacterium]|jgi:ABC-2 type transport system permease protein